MVTGIQSVTETKANKSPAPSTLKDRPTFGSRLITVKVYNFPSNTPGAIDISKNSFKVAAKKIIPSLRFGVRLHIDISTAAIDEMRIIQKGVACASSIIYGAGISGMALAMKLVIKVLLNIPRAIRLIVTNNVGISMLRGASSLIIVLFSSFAGFGTLLYPISIIRNKITDLIKLEINSAPTKCQVPAWAAP